MSSLIHLWKSLVEGGKATTKCGIPVTGRMNVLWAATAEQLKIPPVRVCKTCYRLGPPWLVAVK